MGSANVMRKGEGLPSNTSGLISVVGFAGQKTSSRICVVGQHPRRVGVLVGGTQWHARSM